ncbi:MAG: rod shape-determining protein MreC [Bacteroidales bacterium]|nr:rod shape-determining protein MreC [Bacteroidales bacterium]
MRSLLNFLKKISNVLLFILLEMIAFYLLAARPNYHNIKFTRVINGTKAAMNRKIDNAVDYFSLRDINKQLVRENEELKNTLQRIYKSDDLTTFSVNDTTYRQQYIYIYARVVNNSVNKQKNYITLNRGTLSGVKADMAVICPDGIVGIIVEAGRNYSIAMSVLNLEFRVSARLSNSGYFGSLTWDGRDVNSLILNEIPNHVNVSVGDTIETTGYSAVFPEGIMIGTISGFDEGGGDFLDIKIKPSTGFRRLSNAYIVANLSKDKQLKLESEIQGTR